MTKRGQVTIFLLVAILLVAAMVVLFLTKDKLSIKGAETTPEEFAPITEYIESCLARSLEDAVRLVGLQGGHINLPENHVEAGLFKAAYGVENNKNAIPSKKAIESEISRYVELTAPFCFDRSELRQYDLSLGDAKAEVSISDKSVGADLRMPLTITQEEGAILHDKT
ncbi:hypothetical protein CMI48_04595 [Candidatus Pacearchaeota archaeon]|nr:hypothetical protein [Candidatus Pacearchaeota archaeon]